MYLFMSHVDFLLERFSFRRRTETGLSPGNNDCQKFSIVAGIEQIDLTALNFFPCPSYVVKL